MKAMLVPALGTLALLAACAPGETPPPSPATATMQQLITPGEGSVYTFSSARSGTCPNLEWHVVVRGGNALGGVISWDNERRVARVSGKLNPDRTFQMTATEVNGRGKASITGQVLADGRFSAKITGAGCESRLIEVPLVRPAGSFGSG